MSSKRFRFLLPFLVYGYRKTLSFQQSLFPGVLVLGDSHARIFTNPRLRLRFPFRYFDVVSIDGATVSGLENPNSKTQALPIFMAKFNQSKSKVVIVQLGEVDTGFVIWYRAQKHGTGINQMLDDAVSNYKKLLLSLSEGKRVICISAPLPTIKSGQDWGAVANARKEVQASQPERTQLALAFNKAIGDFCKKQKIEYLNFDRESIGRDGLVDTRLLNKSPADHHYDPCAYIKLITPRLRKSAALKTRAAQPARDQR